MRYEPTRVEQQSSVRACVGAKNFHDTHSIEDVSLALCTDDRMDADAVTTTSRDGRDDRRAVTVRVKQGPEASPLMQYSATSYNFLGSAPNILSLNISVVRLTASS